MLNQPITDMLRPLIRDAGEIAKGNNRRRFRVAEVEQNLAALRAWNSTFEIPDVIAFDDFVHSRQSVAESLFASRRVRPCDRVLRFPIRTKAGASLKATIIEAASGKIPGNKASEQKAYRARAQDWFKSVDGGRELADKMFALGVWPTLKPQLMPFCNAVRNALGLAEVEDVRP